MREFIEDNKYNTENLHLGTFMGISYIFLDVAECPWTSFDPCNNQYTKRVLCIDMYYINTQNIYYCIFTKLKHLPIFIIVTLYTYVMKCISILIHNKSQMYCYFLHYTQNYNQRIDNKHAYFTAFYCKNTCFTVSICACAPCKFKKIITKFRNKREKSSNSEVETSK